MERHPAAKEKQRGHTADNKQVEIFGKVEETEMDTGVFRMVACCELAFLMVLIITFGLHF